jgi:hypothetical protein
MFFPFQIATLAVSATFGFSLFSRIIPGTQALAAASQTRVTPCVEEARLSAVENAMTRLVNMKAVDAKVYESEDPRFVSRNGNTLTYEFMLQTYDDYRGGVWPARERHQVVVVFDRKARSPEAGCRVQNSTMLDVWY